MTFGYNPMPARVAEPQEGREAVLDDDGEGLGHDGRKYDGWVEPFRGRAYFISDSPYKMERAEYISSVHDSPHKMY